MEEINNVRHGKAGGRICLVILVLALTLSGLFVRPVQAQSEGDGTIVRCEPTTIIVDVGEQFSIDMYVQDVVELHGVDLGITFDPNIVQAVDTAPFIPGTQIVPLGDFLPIGTIYLYEAYNDTGQAQYRMAKIGPGGVTGSGSVARIFFTGTQEGSFTMEYFLHEMSDSSFNLIPHTTQDCLVTIGTPTAVHLSATSAGQSSGMAVAVGVATLLLGVVTGWGVWHRRSRPGEV